ncbi:MAG TPA: glycosyltransferase N-terminal domain-containing protein, partial [Bdellovibrionota bacterium]|nr:glycosyltransferase N-terminal domain-containing protein [Bdellovibrionota bacterium]
LVPASLGARPRAGGKARSCWFHAASAGELESLWTVVLMASQTFDDVIVTGFSESVGERLKRLGASLADTGKPARWIGYSPLEGEWGPALAAARPSLFVTAKYEAWPELWLGLGQLGIPLVIVGARSRSSLKVAKAACGLLGGRMPPLHLLTVHSDDGHELEALFPSARIQSTGDPRWDRVQARASSGSARARQLVRAFQGWPRPWGVLGQVWEQDVKVWASELAKSRGTLWVIPHKVDPESVSRIEAAVLAAGISVIRTSRLAGEEIVGTPKDGSPVAILGDEMGFLSELYSAVDWAYIGGGFGDGVHSTIEPAVHGIPLAAGPKNAEKFAEIGELKKTGQLRIVTSPKEIAAWHAFAASAAESDASSEAWRRQALERLGSTDRVMQALVAATTTPA